MKAGAGIGERGAATGAATGGGFKAARAAAAGGNVWVIYPLNPAPGQPWLPYAWVILGIIGAATQLGWTGGDARIHRKKKSS